MYIIYAVIMSSTKWEYLYVQVHAQLVSCFNRSSADGARPFPKPMKISRIMWTLIACKHSHMNGTIRPLFFPIRIRYYRLRAPYHSLISYNMWNKLFCFLKMVFLCQNCFFFIFTVSIATLLRSFNKFIIHFKYSYLSFYSLMNYLVSFVKSFKLLFFNVIKNSVPLFLINKIT